jgi:Family of unknown function (DUF5343)
MAFQSGDLVPYAGPANVIDVLRRFRERGLPGPVTTEVLERAGISQTLSGRTLQALKLIGFLTAEGEQSEEFKAANRSPEEDYKQRIGEILVEAYSEAIAFADPATDSYDSVRDAFRAYNPQSQQERMITLFLGLLDYAGHDTSTAVSSRKKAPAESSAKTARGNGSAGQSRAPIAAPRRRGRPAAKDSKPSGSMTAVDAGDLPPGLVGLLHQIPRGGDPWTKETRDNFLAAFSAVLDFSVPIGTPTASTDPQEAAEQV